MANVIPTTDATSSLDRTFYLPADEFFPGCLPNGLTFDDVSLATLYSEILPRQSNLDVRISHDLQLHIPVLSADMDTVTESAMAIAMALNGGLGIIHYNMTPQEQVKEVARVKNHIHGFIQEPITSPPDALIGDVIRLIETKRFKFSTFPVVDSSNRLLGLLPGRVVKQRYANRAVADAMLKIDEVYTLHEHEIANDPIGAADRFFNEHIGIHKLLVVDDQGRLRGLFTMSDIERLNEEAKLDVKPARDSRFRLVCAAALAAHRRPSGELDRDALLDHTANLVAEGVDAVAVSTAHGHSKGVGEQVSLIRQRFPSLTIIAGNVTSAEGVAYLADCGVNAVKVGQGPGSICTTRIVAGVGIPQLTALYVASRAARAKGVTILADGGITRSGDVVKALTLADAVICGGLFAGCREAPGRIIEINGKLYKQYRGMGSHTAMKEGSAARYGHEHTDVQRKAAAEGIEALKELSGSADAVLRELVGGLQSGLGYLGARTLPDLKNRARFIRVSPAGQREASPHDVITMKTTEPAETVEHSHSYS